MRRSIFILLCFVAINAIEETENFAGSSGHGSGGAHGSGGSHGSGSGGKGGGTGGKGGGGGFVTGGGGGPKGGYDSTAGGKVPSNYYYNPYYYHYYYIYHGHNSHEDNGSAETQLPAATAQDKADAANIVNAKFDEKVIASILPFRDQIHRQVINNEIANYNNGKRFIPPKYLPNHKSNPIFKDVCFGLVNDPVKVLAMYLGEFLHRKDETFIIIALTLCQEMTALHYIYNHNHKNSLKKRRKKQRHPFSNLMRRWIARDRDPDDVVFTPQDVNNDAETLKKEYPHWKKDRDFLEDTLIRRSLKFGLAVIQKFEADLKISIEDAIKQKIKNHDLVDAYTSFAVYVKNKYNYMATAMLRHSDGTDRWAVWIMMIGITTPEDWSKVNDAFKAINNNVSLTDQILKTTDADRIPFEMMAVTIDPAYKPYYS